MEIVEGRNTGVPLILSSMKNNGSDIPVFETDEDRSYFLTILPIHPLFTGQSKKVHDTQTIKVRTRRNRDELKSVVRNLLIENGGMSTNEIAYALV